MPLAARPAGAGPALQVFPNPATGHATLTEAAPGGAVEVCDVLGRRLGSATAAREGTATLTLPTGLYLVRAGT